LRFIAGAVLVGVLWWASDLLAPLCLAGFVALTLNPLVSRLARWMPRSIAALTAVVLALAILAGGVYALADDVAGAIEGMPGAVRELRVMVQQKAASSNGPLGSLDRAIAEAQRLWQSTPVPSAAPPDLRTPLLILSGRALSASTQAVTLLFLIYFLLATGESLRLKAVRLSGQRLSQRKITVEVVEQLLTQVSQYAIYLIVSGILVGVATALVFWWLGVAYAPLWGLAAGVLNAVPYLGPVIVMIGSGAAALVQFQSPGMALAVGGASLVITSVEGMILMPILFGRVHRIHPVAVFVSIVFWSWLWGPIGTFLAVPITTAMKTVMDYLPAAGKTSELLDDGTTPTTTDTTRTSLEGAKA
jgi:predicted PurR-regulated permease PerM